jgi:DnaK suppressor protein
MFHMDTQHFKELLDSEVLVLENELAGIGRKNPDKKGDWEAVEPDNSVDSADEGDVAEGIERYENNSAVLNQLEIRLAEVKSALEKIENGVYGICEECEAPIEEDRLEANPAAKTCKMHMNI